MYPKETVQNQIGNTDGKVRLLLLFTTVVDLNISQTFVQTHQRQISRKHDVQSRNTEFTFVA